jgi:ribosome-associated protein
MTEPLPDDELQPSKTRRKREAEARQQLGAALLKLSKSAFAQIPLPEKLADALAEARRIRQHGALKRQLQYIGKLMREVDVEPIQAAYDRATHPLQEDVEQHHRLEQWRDRLLEDGDAALGELLANHPDLDRQHIRQLVRSARKEAGNDKPPRAARELFRYLREVTRDE